MCRLEYSCKSVGSYVDASGATKSLAMAWDGAKWSITATPTPSGATSSELTGVSCNSWFCAAVGSYTDSNGLTKPLINHWDGESWSVATLAPPADAVSSELAGVACTATNSCQAVGSAAFEAGAANGGLAGQLTGSTWALTYPVAHMAKPAYETETSRWLSLQAKSDISGNTTARFQYKLPTGSWTDIPLAQLFDANGKVLESKDVTLSGGSTPTITWDVPPTVQTEISQSRYDLEVRASMSGTLGGVTEGTQVMLDPRGFSSDDAGESVGLGELDLVTGNFSIAEADATLTSWAADTTVTRTLNSRDPAASYPAGAFGVGWVLGVPDDVASEYSMLQELTDSYGGAYVELKSTSGATVDFNLVTGTYEPPTGFEYLSLVKKSATEFQLIEDAGNTMIFTQKSGTTIFVPTEIRQPPSENSSTIRYTVVNEKPRVSNVVAPVPASVNCESLSTKGCRSLELVYSGSTSATGTSEAQWGTYKDTVEQIKITAYDPATSAMKTDTVAQYLYDNTGKLRAEWDPRISPALKARYSYDAQGHLTELKPPGQNAWTMAYRVNAGDGNLGGRLASVSRSTPQGTATTTIAYNVPLTGASAPYAMGPANVETWAQTDDPVGATAIFPPDSVPSDPPANYTRATISYMNAAGREVNVISPGGWTTTTEYDQFGNIVRELSARNRERALAAGASSATVAKTLDTQRVFTTDGIEMTEELGPQHQVELESGSVVEARSRTTIAYDEGAPSEDDPHLPTKTTVQAKVVGGSESADARVTKTEYDWTLLEPTKVIRDYGGLNITESWTYDSTTGLETVHTPPNGSKERTTTYYKAAAGGSCGSKAEWANLPCEVNNYAMTGESSDLPALPVEKFEYNRLNEPTKTTETVEDRERSTTLAYDSAGRKTSSKVGTTTDQEGLVAAYGFEESSGATAADSSGNGNIGTLENITHVSQGRFGRALDFDSASDQVVVGDSNSLDLTGAMTLEAWVRPDAIGSATAQKIIEKGGSAECTAPAYGLYASSSATLTQPRGFACNTSIEGTSPRLPKGMWSHVALTVSASKAAKIYVDGVQTASGTIGSLSKATTGKLLIGPGFDGQIDEVRVYNRELSATEIKDDMTIAVDTTTAPPTPPLPLSGLVGAWGFEEKATSTKVIDSSTSANNGTVTTSTRTFGGHHGAGLETMFGGNATIPDSNSLDLTNGITLEAWVAPQTLETGTWRIVEKTEAYSLTANGSGTLFFNVGGYSVSAASALVAGRADHVEGTYDGTTLRLYVNGVLKASGAGGTPAPTNSKSVLVGFGRGRTDEVRIYNRALSASELEQDAGNAVTPAQSAVTNGTGLPTVSYGYDSSTGLPTTSSATSDGATRTITTGYDAVGRATSYQDADGNTSTTTYDIDSRPVEVYDGKGTETYTYDSVTGLPTKLVDSQAGTFTATYNSDGQMTAEVYPNGMTAATVFDEAGSPTSLAYTKSGCPTCVWYEEKIKESIQGQWLNHESTLSNQKYTYDHVGRLTLVKDTPAGKGCTTRAYTYDADSNRLSLTTRAPNEKGECVTSGGGTVQSSSYDKADRITNSGFTYDPFGRETTIPSSHSGGGQLTMSYYTNDMVRTETQDGKTVGWLLDPTQSRQRATISEGTKQDIMHYANGSDSPAWVAHTVSGSVTSWDRNVGALDGGLGATVSYDGTKTTVELQMANLHGDIIGTASPEAGASGPTKTFEATEFGVPREASTRKYSWLGAKQRATTLASGVIQMGVRAYVPAMGRFTSVDPVYGGSANSYDYAMQDPLQNYDLGGECTIRVHTVRFPDPHKTFYLDKGCTRRLARSIYTTLTGDVTSRMIASAASTACGMIRAAGPLGWLGAAACSAFVTVKFEEFKKDLLYAFQTYRCLTFYIPWIPGVPLHGVFIPAWHWGASKQPEWCPPLT